MSKPNTIQELYEAIKESWGDQRKVKDLLYEWTKLTVKNVEQLKANLTKGEK